MENEANPCKKIRRDDTVGQLDIDRYMGRWYEIARFDHRFERRMDNVTAEYTLRPDGKVSVVNSGRRNGKVKTAHGVAKIPDPMKPGKLKVSFFLWFYADYYVLELAEDYSYALIGSRSDRYLWILSRTPYLSDEVKERLMESARCRGYDVSKLLWIGHDV